MKARVATLGLPVCLVFAIACSESTSSRPTLAGSSSLIIVPTGTLDQNILQILALFPNGLETAATTRWGNVKSKYAAGLTDASQMAVAKQMAFELSDWVNKKAPNMDTPPNGETRVSASARAVQYMLMYIYSGPSTPVPSYSPAADAIVGLVTPGAPATIVTPTGHAGVQFEAGSVTENTVIVISQNLTPYPDNCSGPLHTLLCQYPQFYNIEQFPHKTLLKGAKISVCHINNPQSPRHPLADHDRFRLAHPKPANPADYTPGSTIRDQFGESIEILPLASQTFVTCELNGVNYASVPGDGLFSRVAKGVMRALTPKTAYAIDQGLGGVSFSFSAFNDVDPDGRPDRAVQALTVTPVCGPTECLAHPGTHLSVHFEVANIGTATTGDGAPGNIQLVQPAIEGPPTVFSVGAFNVGASLAPGSTTIYTQDVIVPPNVTPGDYTVRVTSGIGFFNEPPANLANNTDTLPISITPNISAATLSALENFDVAYRGAGLGGQAIDGQIDQSGVLSDELGWAETFFGRGQLDQRSIAVGNTWVRDGFHDLQLARASLAFAADQYAGTSPQSPARSELLSLSGYADLFAAENYCSGVPTATFDATGAVLYGAQQTTGDLYATAVAKFDQALAIANASELASPTILGLANLGKARAQLDMNNFADAAATAGQVPSDFSYNINAAASPPRAVNGVYYAQNILHYWPVSNNEGGNGLPYRSDADPRVTFTSPGTLGADGVTTLFLQAKYAGVASQTPLADGLEARLIEAESFLRLGDLENFTARINFVRVQFGLAPVLPPATGADARTLLFKERAYTLWLTAHRLGDLRRLVRQYDLSQVSVFPNGPYPKGGVYGSDVNIPIPTNPQDNPTGMACLDRNP